MVGMASIWRRVRASDVSGIVILKASADIVSRLSLTLISVLILRSGGADDLGAWTQLQVMVSVVGPLATLGLGNALVPWFAPRAWTVATRRRASEIVVIATGASCALALALAVTAPHVDDAILDWPRGAALFRWGSLLVSVAGVQAVVYLLLQAREKLALYVVFQVALTAVTVAAGAVVLPGGGDLVAFARFAGFGQIAVTGAVAFAALAWTVRERDETPPPTVRAMLRFGIWVSIADAGAWAVQLADRLVLGWLRDAEVVGTYAAVYTVSGVITILAAAVFLPAYPHLARAASREALTLTVLSYHRAVAYVVVPSMFLMALMTKPALEVVGKGETDPGLAVVLLVVGSIAVNRWNGLAHYVLLVAEGGTAVRAPWIAGGLVAIATSLALIPPWGMIGASLSTLLALATVDVLLLIRAARHIDLRDAYAWRATATATLASAAASVVAIIVLATFPANLVSLAAASAAFVVVYVFAVAASRTVAAVS